MSVLNWWWTPIKRLLAVALAAVLILPLAGCGSSAEQTLETVPSPPSSPKPPQQKIAEVSPPDLIQKLHPALDRYQPQVKILSPQSEEILADNTVTVQLDVRDFPTFRDQTLGLGPHLHFILDDGRDRDIYNPQEPLILPDLKPGTHTLRVFAVYPWGESFKNDGALSSTTFHIYTKTPDNHPDLDLPLLTYNRPRGTYGAEPILLDFYLDNAPLHLVAQEDPEDEIVDWRIRVTVNGESFVLDRWEPIYLKGFQPGKNWVQLEFLDELGEPLDNVYNTTARVLTYDPDRQDPLSQLVRGQLSLAQARSLVEFDSISPITPAPEIEEEPETPAEEEPVVEEEPEIPVEEEPAIEEEVEAPVEEEPVIIEEIEAPTEQEPAIEEEVEAPVEEEPVVEEPETPTEEAVEEPETPVAEEPAVEEPEMPTEETLEEPVVEEPAVEEPEIPAEEASEESTVEEPETPAEEEPEAVAPEIPEEPGENPIQKFLGQFQLPKFGGDRGETPSSEASGGGIQNLLNRFRIPFLSSEEPTPGAPATLPEILEEVPEPEPVEELPPFASPDLVPDLDLPVEEDIQEPTVEEMFDSESELMPETGAEESPVEEMFESEPEPMPEVDIEASEIEAIEPEPMPEADIEASEIEAIEPEPIAETEVEVEESPVEEVVEPEPEPVEMEAEEVPAETVSNPQSEA
ncbi:hypothetical protein [Lyngbya sp. CCY1209]|uniref:hypothetical protein n=1 Tax=Lyngbya sp. CCY1209 TaxID=2886103 RepID=UPI002D1FEE8C|nr:hypothetical protein [Lyngbya sp. CCY1209]MEB3887096.1 hypothetical protein [Lyngbya sp. CCY1209]